MSEDQLDRIDRNILAALSRDARLSMAELGRKVGLSGAGVEDVAVAFELMRIMAPQSADFTLPFRALAGLGALAAVSVTALAFEGHALGSLPLMIYLGVLFGANLALAVPAGLARLALTRLPPVPARIALRVVASWCAAIAVMLAAFELR